MLERFRPNFIRNSIVALSLTPGLGMAAYAAVDIYSIGQNQDNIQRTLDEEGHNLTLTQLDDLRNKLDSLEGRINRDHILGATGLVLLVGAAGTNLVTTIKR